MAIRLVPIATKADGARVIKVEDGSTNGAVVGLSLLLDDGTVVTPEMILNQYVTVDPSLNDFVLWQQLAEIPANVRALAGAIGTGLFAVTGDATGAFRAIESVAGETTVANGTGVAGNPAVGLSDVAPAAGGTLQLTQFDVKGRRSHQGAATTDNLPEGIENLYYTDVRVNAFINTIKGQPNGLAPLDAGGKLDGAFLPDLAITDTFVVASQVAMLALTAERGDVAVRTDLNKSLILTASPASTLANWQELLTPTSPVTSVFGRVGAVVAQSGDYTAAQVGAEPTIAAGTTAQYWRGDKTWQNLATVATSGAYSDLSGAPALASGAWTPTATAVANVSSTSGIFGRYMRVDGVVGFGGQIQVTPTTNTGVTSFRLSLPVGTTFSSISDATGVIYVSNSATGAFVASGFVRADTVSNELLVQFVTNTTANCAIRFDGSYEI